MVYKDNIMSYIDIYDPELTFETEIIVHEKLSIDWTWDYIEEQSSWGPALIFWLVSSGRGTFQIGDERYKVQRGSFFALPTKGFVYKGRHDIENPLELSWILFKVRKDGKTIDVRGISGLPMSFDFSQVDFGLTLMNRVIVSTGKQRELWLRMFLDEAHRQHRFSMESKTSLDRLAEKIMNHPGQFKGLDDMYEYYPSSRDHLIRLFRNRYGVTPHEFLIQNRMDHARKLLSFSSLPLLEIARMLGYSDQFSFSKQFKKRIGISPGRFRKPDTAK